MSSSIDIAAWTPQPYTGTSAHELHHYGVSTSGTTIYGDG